MDQRARIPVTLPLPNPTPSYWQTPPSPLANHRTTPTLPPSADIIIIGSGITGASAAWHLLSTSIPPPTILMLEARQTSSGATGRNGGHTKAASYRTFPAHAAALGLPAAVQLARFELDTIRAVHAFARDHGIECDLAACDTVDVLYDAAQWEEARGAVEAMREAMPGEVEGGAARYVLYEGEEVKRRFRVVDDGEEVCGGVGYFAGSLSAYRFAVGVVGMCVARGMGLHTGTAVTGLERDGGSGRWRVETGRGVVEAGRVVLATNGWTAGLVREFQGVVVPLRGQVQVHRPGRGLKEGGPLEGTYSFIYEDGYEYMVPRPVGAKGEGDIMMGGGLAKAPEGGLLEYGTTDDTVVEETVSWYLEQTTARYFGKNWGEDDGQGRVKSEWTGIMGFSPDGFPFVGEVPGKKGLWISASFQGHGMVLAWKSAQALVEMMEGRDDEKLAAWFPSAFRVSEERMAKRFEGRLQ
ncbi:FAD dependent oxidoreductase [Podospora conica]|nr:FAD dependent oxidoreductase [Schizothecium conicum]